MVSTGLCIATGIKLETVNYIFEHIGHTESQSWLRFIKIGDLDEMLAAFARLGWKKLKFYQCKNTCLAPSGK